MSIPDRFETAVNDIHGRISATRVHSVFRPRSRALPGSWSIVQKQTGADGLTLGGSLAVNAHGRGLDLPPFSAHVDSFVVIGPDGTRRVCARDRDADLFASVVGGYGMFGVVESLTLRLQQRFRVRRRVGIRTATTSSAAASSPATSRPGTRSRNSRANWARRAFAAC